MNNVCSSCVTIILQKDVFADPMMGRFTVDGRNRFFSFTLVNSIFCRYCATWAKDDECQKNPTWMLKNCPVSCKECENQCADHNVNCQAWATKNITDIHSQCNQNPDYMNVYCRASCKKCTPSGSCKNDKNDCDGWAKKGYCKSSKYKQFMGLRCKKACGLC